MKRKLIVALALITALLLGLAACGEREIEGVATSDEEGTETFSFIDALELEIPKAWGYRAEDDGAVGFYNDENGATRGMTLVAFDKAGDEKDAEEKSLGEWAEAIVANEDTCGEISETEIGNGIKAISFNATKNLTEKNKETGEETIKSSEYWCYYLFEAGDKIVSVGVLNTDEADFSEYADIVSSITLK